MVDCTEHVWKKYHTELYNFIRSRLGTDSAADDILQEVFIRIHSQIESLKDCNKIQAWIYQIARNAVIDYYRARKNTKELPSSLTTPEQKLNDKAKEDVNACIIPMIESLPDNYRQALMLSEIQGQTQQNVAEEQGISLSGAKSRIQRGRIMLKEMMLQCCHFEFDQRGNVIDYQRRRDSSCESC